MVSLTLSLQIMLCRDTEIIKDSDTNENSDVNETGETQSLKLPYQLTHEIDQYNIMLDPYRHSWFRIITLQLIAIALATGGSMMRMAFDLMQGSVYRPSASLTFSLLVEYFAFMAGILLGYTTLCVGLYTPRAYKQTPLIGHSEADLVRLSSWRRFAWPFRIMWWTFVLSTFGAIIGFLDLMLPTYLLNDVNNNG